MPGAGIDGGRLRERRAALGITQAELARRSGISQEAISRIENGRIRGLMQPTQDALADALETSVSWLRGGSTDEGPADARVAEAHGELELVLDEGDPLVEAVGRAFDAERHTMLDSFAVLRTLRETDRRLVEGDLLAAARRWLDAAAALRREGISVSMESLLMRITAGESPRAREGQRIREAEWAAEAEEASAREEGPGATAGAPRPRRR
ncbi:MAG: helix-turn-helix domain-containing protein [Polyangiales bacterium]